MNTDTNLKILVCCHKKTNLPNDTQDILLPIQVGASKSKINLGFQKDDTLFGNSCDNISEKNNIYCELTAMYWAWKNIKILYPEISYIGLCHYRRFFFVKRNILREIARYFISVLKPSLKLFLGQINHSNYIFTTEYVSNFKDNILEESNKIIKKIASNYDIITTIPIKFVDTDVRDFFNVIGRAYINLTERIVKEFFGEYYEALENVLSGNKLSCANMFICKVEMLDEYCSFIFGVLEKHIELVKQENLCINPEKEGIYSRVSGYLAEFLTYTYIVKKNRDGAKIKYLNKVFINNSDTELF